MLNALYSSDLCIQNDPTYEMTINHGALHLWSLSVRGSTGKCTAQHCPGSNRLIMSPIVVAETSLGICLQMKERWLGYLPGHRCALDSNNVLVHARRFGP
jgi:hypothetical protein